MSESRENMKKRHSRSDDEQNKMCKNEHGSRQDLSFDPGTLKRLMTYMKSYRPQLITVTVCIILSAIASAASSMFLQTLIDDYITPLLGSQHPVFTGLLRALAVIGVIYAVGTIANLIYNRIMVTVAQGTLKKIRDEMFTKMQRLPVSFFDSHTHGDIMSLYTNDTDTLRQMIAQSMAQVVSSVVTIIAVFFCMLYISIWLTIVVVVAMFFIMKVVGYVAGKSGSSFVEQQRTLADLDGYVEEMVNGQKVIKVFCYENKTKEEMRTRNKAWEMSASNANGHANAMMPMMNALGYIQYVIIAVLGAYMAIAGVTNLGLFGTGVMTLGMIASFLTLSRNFTNPVSQISNQFNSIVTALAGAARIFEFMDEEPETDNGYVTLVNVKKGEWAWKPICLPVLLWKI